MTTTDSTTTPARAPGTVPALVLPLDPQPDMIPFQIVGDRSGRWYNWRKRYRRTGRGPMLIAWRPPSRQHVPAQRGETWVWQNIALAVNTASKPAGQERKP